MHFWIHAYGCIKLPLDCFNNFKTGHGFSQIYTDFLNNLLSVFIRVYPCPK